MGERASGQREREREGERVVRIVRNYDKMGRKVEWSWGGFAAPPNSAE